jgi:hypothetical protein
MSCPVHAPGRRSSGGGLQFEAQDQLILAPGAFQADDLVVGDRGGQPSPAPQPRSVTTWDSRPVTKQNDGLLSPDSAGSGAPECCSAQHLTT